MGIQNVSLKTNMLDFGTAYPIDPVVAQSAYVNTIKPDINLGLMAYGAQWFAGVAVQQIIPQKSVLIMVNSMEIVLQFSMESWSRTSFCKQDIGY